MPSYKIVFTKQAEKDVKELTPRLKEKLKTILLNVIAVDPFAGKKLLGELSGSYSYRLSYKDRIVYDIDKLKKIITILRAKTHYGE
ncbi:MAG: type II toxin-antitoxin system mRNA interferase toxin, RelE/StbE family [Deltaproteobacteria bacterium]|nr:type II toxin-antitoxin system mRNA interferase toxin, RelE/StbE family [Deltaproteobacteria bacterium]